MAPAFSAMALTPGVVPPITLTPARHLARPGMPPGSLCAIYSASPHP